jgi:hypothetical protein
MWVQTGTFHMLRSSCRSACRAIPCPARGSRATENMRRSFRPWTRRRKCGGCGGPKGSGPPAAGGDPRAWVPLVIRKGNLATEGDYLLGAGCRGFAPSADSARVEGRVGGGCSYADQGVLCGCLSGLDDALAADTTTGLGKRARRRDGPGWIVMPDQVHELGCLAGPTVVTGVLRRAFRCRAVVAHSPRRAPAGRVATGSGTATRGAATRAWPA